MQYCKKCRISIRGNKSCCPLCQGELTGGPTEDAFPCLEQRKDQQSLCAENCHFLFCSGGNRLSCHLFFAGHPYAVDSLYYGRILGSLAGSGNWHVLQKQCGEKYYYADIYRHGRLSPGRSSHGFPRLVRSVGSALLFCRTGGDNHGGGKGNGYPLEGYILYLAVDMVLANCQLIFLMLKMNSFVWPAVISLIFVWILAAAALIFRFRVLKSAARKNFHL